MMASLAVVALAGVALPGGPLDEQQAVALALQNSPQLRWHDHAVDEAVALTQASLAWSNPLLHVSGLRFDRVVEPALDRRAYGEHPFDHTTVALRWSPPGLGERAARRAEGEAREVEARMQLAISRRDTIAWVRKLHAEILGEDAQIALLRDAVEQCERLRALIQRRLELQAATLLDQSLTEVDYLEARTQLVELEVRRRAHYDELLIQLGLPPGTVLTLAPTPVTCGAPGNGDRLAARAREVDPRRRALAAERSAVDAEGRRLRLELVPWFDYVQVGYGAAGSDHPGFVAFQFQLTLPLLDWKRPRQRALGARAQALDDHMQADERALTELVVRSAAAQAEQAALVERYREAARVVEQGVADLHKALAQAGPTNLLEILQLQTRLLLTQRASLRAQLDCKLEQIELDRLTGAAAEGTP